MVLQPLNPVEPRIPRLSFIIYYDDSLKAIKKSLRIIRLPLPFIML